MNPNQSKDQDRNTIGKKTPSDPREKQREEPSTAAPDRRDPDRKKEMNHPAGTRVSNRPFDDKRGRPVGREHQPDPGRQPRKDDDPLQEPGFESDTLKPER